MNICLVYDCEYPWDIRVEKFTHSLSKHGHNVSLLVRNKRGDQLHSKKDYHEIFRLPTSKSKLLNSLFNVTLFFNPFWIFYLFRVARITHSDLIIVRDLPLSGTGLLIGKLLNIPVFVDMAEPYPLTIRQRRYFEPFRASHFITRNILFSDLYEKVVFHLADHIFVVCDEAKRRLVNLGAVGNRISVVHNTPDIQKFDNRLTSKKDTFFSSSDFIILYAGILIGGRGLDVAIDAMEILSNKYNNIKLFIIGTGKAEAELKKKVKDLGLESTVIFKGWIDNDLLPGYIKSCDIGILPFSNTQHINHTIANKLFDFMAMSKAVICSDVEPMKRIILEEKCGYTFESDNPVSLADTILNSYHDNSIVQLGVNGHKSIVERYNWFTDEKVLCDRVSDFN